jgi:hypothetical protein
VRGKVREECPEEEAEADGSGVTQHDFEGLARVIETFQRLEPDKLLAT